MNHRCAESHWVSSTSWPSQISASAATLSCSVLRALSSVLGDRASPRTFTHSLMSTYSTAEKDEMVRCNTALQADATVVRRCLPASTVTAIQRQLCSSSKRHCEWTTDVDGLHAVISSVQAVMSNSDRCG
ncbi:hypothetical protein BD311DRAFT_461615 [Dichomitus squalens]|uniref:Uncharacterized protein n=1 Tax=Dichomitus squalens TaxID=114155 RepID=A0A4V2JZQ9_9APHY|nr:hypothetical protein BD311DRAFT_461615 [Dichomitus squalens]